MQVSTSDLRSFPGGFTVLMSVYARDNPELFVKAVNSVFENTLLPDAFVLVVDGPVPIKLDEIINHFVRKYDLNVVRLAVNSGLANALNAGLDHVKTRWVARADADDYNLPNRFELQAAAVNQAKTPLTIVGGVIEEVDVDGTFISYRRPPITHEEILTFSRKRNPFNHMTVAFDVNLVNVCGRYPNIFLKEDYALWITMLSKDGRGANINQILVKATTGKEMYKRRGGLKYALAEISLQMHLIKMKTKTPFSACLDGVARGAVFLFPSSARGLIYKYFLRRV